MFGSFFYHNKEVFKEKAALLRQMIRKLKNLVTILKIYLKIINKVLFPILITFFDGKEKVLPDTIIMANK